MKATLILALILFGGIAHAQNVAPLVTECGPKCSGAFQIQNNSVSPILFTIEAMSLGFDPGVPRPIDTPLNAGVTAKLSQSSGRLGQKEIREIDFSIRCEVMPCAVQLVAGFVAGHTASGIAMRMVIPHSVYIDNKGKGARSRFLSAAGITPPKR